MLSVVLSTLSLVLALVYSSLLHSIVPQLVVDLPKLFVRKQELLLLEEIFSRLYGAREDNRWSLCLHKKFFDENVI